MPSELIYKLPWLVSLDKSWISLRRLRIPTLRLLVALTVLDGCSSIPLFVIVSVTGMITGPDSTTNSIRSSSLVSGTVVRKAVVMGGRREKLLGPWLLFL